MSDKKTHFINGEWQPGLAAHFASQNPATGEAVWEGKAANKQQVDQAVTAASTAFSVWSALSVEERATYLERFVALLKGKSAAIAAAISKEVGKPLWESKSEVSAMVGKLAPTLDAYKQRNSDQSRPFNTTSIVRTRFRPHGVVAVLGPYNFPGHMPNGHIMPALLAGNAVVFKPSEHGALVAELVIQCWEEARLPSGVINLIQGAADVGQALCHHHLVEGVFFTGSRLVGESIACEIGPHKACALEMGGNSPLVVWDCSNVDAAVVAVIQSSFVTAGQRCSAARRLIVRNGDSTKTRTNLTDATGGPLDFRLDSRRLWKMNQSQIIEEMGQFYPFLGAGTWTRETGVYVIPRFRFNRAGDSWLQTVEQSLLQIEMGGSDLANPPGSLEVVYDQLAIAGAIPAELEGI